MGGVAPPNGAVLSAVRNNSYNRSNIIRIPEIYKDREIAGPPARKELKENQVHPARKELKEHRANVLLHHLFKRLYALIHHVRRPRAYSRSVIFPIKQLRPS